MSSEFAATFVPDLTSHLQQGPLWQLLFPPQTQALCTAPSWQLEIPILGSVELRWPLLAPLIALGVLVGIIGWLQLRNAATTLQQLWATSFFWFAMMNLTAAPCHNLLRPEPATSFAYLVWRALDVGCTAAACATAILAARHTPPSTAPASSSTQMQKTPKTSKSLPGKETAGSHSSAALYAHLLAVLLVAAALAGNIKQVPWVNEVLYPGSLVICVSIVSGYTRRPQHVSTQRSCTGLYIAYAGLAVALAGLPLDPWLCQTLGPQVTFVHVLFLGCDIIYWGLLVHLTA